MERKRKNLSIFFVYTKILSTFAIAKHIVRYRTTGGERRPTSRVWAFFMLHTSRGHMILTTPLAVAPQ